ncbi:NAD(P)-binding protein [Wilcoxina mikolae CBS 423.85]|nr:NAD(P)-binding protein [Wilcoxina mikolae CBS 423.85]
MSNSSAPPSKPGQFAQTNSSITAEYPEKLPSTTPVRRTKRTLASFSLEGKTAIITGGARGLGYVMTQALIESGADVAIVDLNEEASKSAERLLAQFKSENPDTGKLPTITAHRADVANPASVEEAFAEILTAHGGHVDTLVTSAGLCENFPAEQYPAERLQHIMSVNINGTYFFASALARHLIEKKQKGSMIFIGSMSGSIVNIPQPQAPYNASKAAVRHLASSFAVEWAKYGIRVNCISPGYMLTDLTKRILEERPELGETWRSLTPVGRMGDPQDLMGAVVYLASDAAGFVTGAELKVDGGYTVT